MFILKRLFDFAFWIAKVKIEQVVLHWIVFKLTYKIQKYILD
jgi:hypothetical protein